MRIEIHSAWVCPSAAYAENAPPARVYANYAKSGRLRVRHALSGALLADWSWSETFDWPWSISDFFIPDLLINLEVPPRQRLLADFIDAQSNVLVERCEDLINNGFSRELLLVYRKCPRCTMCNGACMRKLADHHLCSHIGTSECRSAWHFSRSKLFVEGYCGGAAGQVARRLIAERIGTELARGEMARIDKETYDELKLRYWNRAG